MLAFCTSPSEIALVLEQSDAKWLSEEMSFLSELYRSKAGSSERQFGGNDNPASASFWETALKCQRLSVALQKPSVAAGAGRTMAPDQHVDASLAIDPPHPALASPSPATSSGSAERETRLTRPRRTAKARAPKKKKGSRSTLHESG